MPVFRPVAKALTASTAAGHGVTPAGQPLGGAILTVGNSVGLGVGSIRWGPMPICLEPYVLTILVVLVAGTRFEQEHRQACGQVSCQLISRGFFTTIIHLSHPLKQLRKVLANGAVHFMHKLLFLLLLAANGLLPSCCRTLFSFFCSALGVNVWFGLSIFSLGV